MPGTITEKPTEKSSKKNNRGLKMPKLLVQRYIIALDNAKKPEILNILKIYNYDEYKLAEGMTLCQVVMELISSQKAEKGAQESVFREPEKLSEEKELIHAALYEGTHNKKDCESAQLRKAFGTAMETLDIWMSRLFTVAKVALRKRPDLLQKLGI